MAQTPSQAVSSPFTTIASQSYTFTFMSLHDTGLVIRCRPTCTRFNHESAVAVYTMHVAPCTLPHRETAG